MINIECELCGGFFETKDLRQLDDINVCIECFGSEQSNEVMEK